jgi:hypothetical protein
MSNSLVVPGMLPRVCCGSSSLRRRQGTTDQQPDGDDPEHERRRHQEAVVGVVGRAALRGEGLRGAAGDQRGQHGPSELASDLLHGSKSRVMERQRLLTSSVLLVPSRQTSAPQTGPATPRPPAASSPGCPLALPARYDSSPKPAGTTLGCDGCPGGQQVLRRHGALLGYVIDSRPAQYSSGSVFLPLIPALGRLRCSWRD